MSLKNQLSMCWLHVLILSWLLAAHLYLYLYLPRLLINSLLSTLSLLMKWKPLNYCKSFFYWAANFWWNRPIFNFVFVSILLLYSHTGNLSLFISPHTINLPHNSFRNRLGFGHASSTIKWIGNLAPTVTIATWGAATQQPFATGGRGGQ